MTTLLQALYVRNLYTSTLCTVLFIQALYARQPLYKHFMYGTLFTSTLCTAIFIQALYVRQPLYKHFMYSTLYTSTL